MKYNPKKIAIVLSFLLVSTTLAIAQTQLSRSVFGNGGPTVSGTGKKVTNTIGQAAAGKTSTGSTQNAIGFWAKQTLGSVDVVIPDTLAAYADTILVPIRIETDVTGHGIVAAEVNIAYDNRIVTLGSPDKTDLTNSMVEVGWSVEENILPAGSGTIDTLALAMSTAQDTLSGQGVLVYMVLYTADIRHPDSTTLELTKVLLNDGTPSANTQNGSIKLIGTNGTIVGTPSPITPNQGITVTITDTDFDVDVGSADQVTATAISKGYNDSQVITLTETGNNTGIFTGSVVTQFATSAGPSNDGIVTTIAGDSICVSYIDSLTSLGTTLTRQDTVEVIGGVDGAIVASYVVQAFDSRNGIRDTVRVQITDADLDTDVGSADQVSATITNAISGEVENVLLTETGNNTGIFQTRVPTVAGASGTNNNGELSLASWDTLNIAYTDNLSSQGGINLLQDTTRVVNIFGDLRSNDQLQAFDAAGILAKAVGLGTYNARDSLLADVDGNGDCQAFDASQVLQYVVRLIHRFPVQTDAAFNPPSDIKNHPFLKPIPLDKLVALGKLQPQKDGSYYLPVHLGERANIVSGTLTLNLGPEIEILDVIPAEDYNSFMTAHNITNTDVKIAFAGSQSPAKGPGEVILLHLSTQENTPVSLNLDHIVLNGQTLTLPSAIEMVQTEIEPQLPDQTQLYQNMPNPFNPETVIAYDLASEGRVSLIIYSITGQQIRTLVSEHQEPGTYQIRWDSKNAAGRAVGSGVYFMRLTTEAFSQTYKMLLLR